MKKQIFILNGKPRSGKDTFAQLLNNFCNVYHYSIVTKVKEIAQMCGWNGGKTNKDRKFLSDLKDLLTNYNDLPYDDVKQKINHFKNFLLYDVMIIDIRDPKEIEIAKREFNAKTILIWNHRVQDSVGNHADDEVLNYKYDYIIENDGTLDEFMENVEKFYKERIKERG